MTIHGSKGLEFRAVHLPALATRYMPTNWRGMPNVARRRRPWSQLARCSRRPRRRRTVPVSSWRCRVRATSCRLVAPNGIRTAKCQARPSSWPLSTGVRSRSAAYEGSGQVLYRPVPSARRPSLRPLSEERDLSSTCSVRRGTATKSSKGCTAAGTSRPTSSFIGASTSPSAGSESNGKQRPAGRRSQRTRPTRRIWAKHGPSVTPSRPFTAARPKRWSRAWPRRSPARPRHMIAASGRSRCNAQGSRYPGSRVIAPDGHGPCAAHTHRPRDQVRGRTSRFTPCCAGAAPRSTLASAVASRLFTFPPAGVFVAPRDDDEADWPSMPRPSPASKRGLPCRSPTSGVVRIASAISCAAAEPTNFRRFFALASLSL